jgi:hypothetical protein
MKVGILLLTLLKRLLTKVRELLNRPTDVHYASFLLTLLKRLFTKVRELLNRPTDVHYTSVPLWRPWRDF